MLIRLHRRPVAGDNPVEKRFYFEIDRTPTVQDMEAFESLVRLPNTVVANQSFYSDDSVCEIGPRLGVETPFSSSAVAICRSLGIPVRRIEMSSRFPIASGTPSPDLLLDEVYRSGITSLDSGQTPEPVTTIPILEQGEAALHEANIKLGLGMDAMDITYNTAMFKRLGRNPTDVELFQIGNGNSEHSRHWFFRGIQVIDGIVMPESLMDIVKAPWKRDPGNSLIAFHDNAGVLRGTEVTMFAPALPGRPSPFVTPSVLQHISATAETHNHPTGIAPFPGAATGVGGRIRDNRAVGRGGLVHAGLSGYFVGTLHIPGYEIPGEVIGGEECVGHASPLKILLQGSSGVANYGNEIGEPSIGGTTRSLGLVVGGVRHEFRKPGLYTAGLGRVLDLHTKKRAPRVGMLIVRFGGPAYRIGVGGGSASSMTHGSQDASLDLKSVQRGNPEMENRANRVIQTCVELLDRNPIQSIHDQGAGGISNVLTELMEPLGGRINIRNVTVGDVTMSVLEIWVAEYQEGYGVLVVPENLEMFRAICTRERVNCEVLGEITGDGDVVAIDSADPWSVVGVTPVQLSLKDILGELPDKRFESNRIPVKLRPFVIPKGLTVDDALRSMFKLIQIGSKRNLTNMKDRSVTGLIAQQQCCGPMQVPVADAAVTADGYFGLTGAAASIGEQPNKMLISPAAGARMSVAEMFTNMASVRISRRSEIRCRGNWMWPAKRPGQGALLYDAALAMRDIMIATNIALDGGKDSLSMATMVENEMVMSPGQLVIMGYAPVPDITKVVTPDLKGGLLGYIDLGQGKCRLGGSALAQTYGELGDESPDIDDPALLRRAFDAIQLMIAEGLITAYHDVSDGGLITTIAEMCIAGNRGVHIALDKTPNIIAQLFSEEAGMVFEYRSSHAKRISEICDEFDLSAWLGFGIPCSAPYENELIITAGSDRVFKQHVVVLRQWWEATATELEKRQANPEMVAAESASHRDGSTLEYHLSFTPTKPLSSFARSLRPQKPKVAILREQGTNGDREMAAAFYATDHDPWDINMQDLLEGNATLDDFQGLVYPGGFSFADVFGSAKGWAAPIRSNPRLKDMFDRFYDRPDTISLGVCNGCQLMTNIGVVPRRDIPENSQPRLLHNTSGRFESRWAGVKILKSPSIFFRGMEGSVLGIWIAHGEGRFAFPDDSILEEVRNGLVPLVYVAPDGEATEAYPYNPNGSPMGMAAICSPDGRHLAMMPHPERCFLPWQWPWMPEKFRDLEASPWLQMFKNSRAFFS
jgi:phosphoribosylformylglycinamidine synthase